MGMFLTGARLLRRMLALTESPYSSPGWYSGVEGGRRITSIAGDIGVSVSYRSGRMTIADMEEVEAGPLYVAYGAYFGSGGGGLSGRLRQNPMTSADATSKATLSTWIYLPNTANHQIIIHWGNTSVLGLGLVLASDDVGFYWENGADSFRMNSAAGLLSPGSWHHVFTSVDTDFSAGAKIGFLYVDGVSVVDPDQTVDESPAFNLDTASGAELLSPYATNGADIELAETQFWFGVCVDPRLYLNKFIRHGLPVDPARATLAFGQQWFLFSGGASDYAHNQGAGGSLVVSGTLINAPNGPGN